MGATEDALRQVERAIIGGSPSQLRTSLGLSLKDILSADELEALVRSVPKEVIESLGWGEVPSRAQMYADSMYATYENSVAAREADNGMLAKRVCQEDSESCEECIDAAFDYFDLLENIPAIGSLQCGSRCRCEFVTSDLEIA